MPPKAEFSYGGVAALASANSDGVVDARHEDLAVADAAGVRRAADRLDRLLDHLVLDDQLDLHLGQEVDDVLGAAIELGVALLAPEALGLKDGDPLQSDLIEGVLHLIELEGLDDRFDLLETPPRADAGAAGRGSTYGLKEAVSVPDFSTLVACEYGAEVTRKCAN